jgi:hypothetical protein
MDSLTRPCVFISYSGSDSNEILEIVRRLQEKEGHQYEFRLWEQDREPGREDWKSIFGWIDRSQIALAFILQKETPEGPSTHAIERSLSVGVEVGYALARGLRVVPVTNLAPTEVSRLGPIAHLVHIQFEEKGIDRTVEYISDFLASSYADVKRSLLPGTKALGRIRRLVFVFGERFYGELDPAAAEIGNRNRGNTSEDEISRLRMLLDHISSSSWPFDQKEFQKLHVTKYRSLLSVCHLFLPGFKRYLDRYVSMGLLSDTLSDVLHDLVEELEMIVEPLTSYEETYSDGGVPRGTIRPTPTAFRLIALRKDKGLNTEAAVLELYSEYRRSNFANRTFKSLNRNFVSLCDLILREEANLFTTA